MLPQDVATGHFFTIRIPWGFQWWRVQFLNVRLRWYNNFWSFVHCCWMHPWIQAHPCGQETCPQELLVFFFPGRSIDRREWNAQIFAAFFSLWVRESSSAQIASVKLLLFKTSKLTFKDYFRSSTYTEQSVFWRMGRACSSWMVSPNVIDTCKDSSEGARPHIHTFNDRLVSLGSVVLR